MYVYIIKDALGYRGKGGGVAAGRSILNTIKRK